MSIEEMLLASLFFWAFILVLLDRDISDKVWLTMKPERAPPPEAFGIFDEEE
tara:strand:+ start:482 stop:637 length:156 start_codon:yes stop_codon:yes gene_type:complete